jgi:hypothetical protein
MSQEDRQAINERKELIEDRARALAESAVERKEPWVRGLGVPPTDPREHERWLRSVSTVAAYRDRYKLASAQAVGRQASSEAQESDRRRALEAARANWLACRAKQGSVVLIGEVSAVSSR